MTFLHKSYGDYSKIEKPVLVTTSYEGSNDKEGLETVPIVNQNNDNYDVVSDSKSESDDNKAEENIFDDDIDEEVKATPKTTVNAKVVLVMKKLQASYNDDASKIVKQATKEIGTNKNLNLLIDLVWKQMIPSQTWMSPRCSMKPEIIPMKNLKENGKKPFARSSIL